MKRILETRTVISRKKGVLLAESEKRVSNLILAPGSVREKGNFSSGNILICCRQKATGYLFQEDIKSVS